MHSVKTYKADAVKSGKFYVVTVHGLPNNVANVTQGLSKTETLHMARDLVALVTDVPIEAVAVDITWK